MDISVLITHKETIFKSDLRKCSSSQIIIGTQGRLFFLINKKPNIFDSVNIVVIDAGGGLQRNEPNPKNSNAVLALLNKNARTWFVSRESDDVMIERMTEIHKDPLILNVKSHIPGGFKHYKVRSNDSKLESLKRCMSKNKDVQKIIYCSGDDNILDLQMELEKDYQTMCLIPAMDPNIVTDKLNEFENKQFLVLIVPSKQYYIRRITVVDQIEIYNYSLPKKSQKYVARIRRNGEYKNDDVFSFVESEEDERKLIKISEQFNYDIQNFYNSNETYNAN